MARRRQSTFEDFIDLVAMLPWWVGVVAAILIYAVLHPIAVAPIVPATSAADMGSMATQTIYRGLAMGGQYILPLGCLTGALVSVFKRRHRRRLLRETQAATDRKAAINAMRWQDFERLVGEAFNRRGFAVTETTAGPDGGVDLELRKDGELHLVQCKQWRATKVGVAIVRELYGVMAARSAAGGFVVTSGVFTKEARAFAEGRNITLMDGAALAGLIGTDVESEAETDQREPVFEMPKRTVAPLCPACSSPMVERLAKRGSNAGQRFWGCTEYPRCKGTRPMLGP